MTKQLHFHFHLHALEKEMAAHSSVLAWRIPGMGEPGGLPSTGSHRVRHTDTLLLSSSSRYIYKTSSLYVIGLELKLLICLYSAPQISSC